VQWPANADEYRPLLPSSLRNETPVANARLPTCHISLVKSSSVAQGEAWTHSAQKVVCKPPTVCRILVYMLTHAYTMCLMHGHKERPVLYDGHLAASHSHLTDCAYIMRIVRLSTVLYFCRCWIHTEIHRIPSIMKSYNTCSTCGYC
jgi:hypothetical protein